MNLKDRIVEARIKMCHSCGITRAEGINPPCENCNIELTLRMVKEDISKCEICSGCMWDVMRVFE